MDFVILQTIYQNFLQELRDANAGKKTSLPFLKHTLPSSPLVKMGETFQVMVVGGSIFQSALVKKNKKLEILEHKSFPLAKFSSGKQLLEFVEKHIDRRVQTVGINFAFGLEATLRGNKIDGKKVFGGSKEHVLTDLIGKEVGLAIEELVQLKQKRTINVGIANDTICLLLSGLTKYSWEELACNIVGTGLNAGFFLEEKVGVNLESSHFDKFPQSKEGKEIDRTSTFPGTALFQKEISGAYLYKHFKDSTLSSTKELSGLAEHDDKSGKKAREILKRSAMLDACQIAAIASFCNRPLIFFTEGSLFWQGYKYKETVEQTIRKLSPSSKVKFVAIENSAILGAAKLVA